MIIENDVMKEGIVPKVLNKNGKVYYKDIDGSISQPFTTATVYAGGFALVKRENDKAYRFRDMLGRISVHKTQSGRDFYEFWKGDLGFEDLKTDYFADERFYKFVKLIVTEKYKPLAQHFAQVCDIKRDVALAMLEEEKDV
ncbi:MAG: hypothetical protein IJX25_03290 [Clostridia bacterium]|nr:hypothetical protein [Clostridia bacterium]MBQ8792289.1 hypothetical protein [Clostridia bacterium]